MQNNNNYNADSVQTLIGLEPFRKSPGMYIGDTNEYGLHHIIKEIINNSVDEALNANCTDIDITLLKDGGVKIKDNGRGFPHGMLDDTFSILGGCFGKEHTGGKFNNSGESGYNTSGGMHGIGCKCAAALGIKTIAISHRDGIEEIVEFSEGKMLKQITDNKCDLSLHGTTVIWYPDPKIFKTTTKFNRDKIEREFCQEYSFLNSGLRFSIKDERDNYFKEYCSKDGIKDYLDYLNGNDEYILDPICLSAQDGNFSIELGIAYNTKYSNSMRLYTNSIPQQKGTHLTGFKTAWTSAINKFAKDNKWLKANDNNLTGDDLSEGQLLIINFKMIDPVFEGQVKENLTSTEGRTYTQKLISSSIEEYLDYNKNGIKAVVEKALGARKAREAAKKAREAARKPKEKGLKAKMKLSNKFIDCANKNPSERNLLLVEGLSAGSAAVEARNAKTDCIYMLRGKIISPLKTSIDKILANQEMSDIIRVIGAGFGDTFDVSKMNFDKIVITTDMDSDGADIELLLITFFFTYMRPLIEAGKLYRAVTPLYIVKIGKEELYFYTEEEMDKFKATHKNNYDVLRAKGLGELDAADLHKVCFEKQRFKRITISDLQKTKVLLDTLQGQAVTPRKQFIYDNAKTLGFEFD